MRGLSTGLSHVSCLATDSHPKLKFLLQETQGFNFDVVYVLIRAGLLGLHVNIQLHPPSRLSRNSLRQEPYRE